MDSFLTSKGRRLVGWDEILEGGLAPGATVMSWRGEEGGIAAANAGHDVVMAPTTYTYFDYYQGEDRETEPLAIGGFLPLSKVYSYEPVHRSIRPSAARWVLGAQCQVWTEYLPTPRHVEYMAFPRLAALAEVVWTPARRKDYSSFLERLSVHLPRLSALDVNYHPIDLSLHPPSLPSTGRRSAEGRGSRGG
jgi:hexosaminidase